MIDGLRYQAEYVNPETEQAMLETIDTQIWQNPFQRRVQHYGYVYDYRRRTIDESMHLGALPAWLQTLAEGLQQDGWIEVVPDQVIINEYVPGQGIALHVDCEPCFGDTILSLSLGSSCVMDFQHVDSGETVSQLLEARSLIGLQGAARYDWKHGIVGRKSDRIGEQIIGRGRRVSLTFRKVIRDYSK
jgi:alkylated DNA repair dioxygenase AlkB